MRLVNAYGWTPENENYCVLTPVRWGVPMFVKYGLTHRGIGPVHTGEPEWLTLEAARILASAAGSGYEVAEKYDSYRIDRRAIAAATAAKAVSAEPATVEAASDYW